MNVRFWGVRGSIPTPEPDRLRYGGNTTCLEIGPANDGEAVVIDCGSGIRALGEELIRRKIRRIHILMTHFHWDHLQGLPLFAPLFQPGTEIIFYTTRSADKVRGLLDTQMTDPFFPVDFEEVGSRTEFRQIESGNAFEAGGLDVDAFPLNHPQGAVGYRAKLNGEVFVHASDHEHGNPEIDAGLIRVAKDADMLVMDAQYTPEEYSTKVGWGHSHYGHAAQVAATAGVRRLMLFHHDPEHNDLFLDGMLAEAGRLFEGTRMATEGGVMKVGAEE